MAKSVIRQRIDELFSAPSSHQDFKDYIVQVRTNLGSAEERLQKLFLRSLFLMVAFVLFSRAGISEFTLGPLKITDLSLVQKLIPAIMAYTYYELHAAATMRRLLREVHDELLNVLNETLAKKDLQFYLLPHSPFVAEEIISRAPDCSLAPLVVNLSLPLIASIIIAPLAFLVYAFMRCFAQFGFGDVLVWIVLIVSFLFSFQGFILFFNCDRLTERKDRGAPNKPDASDGS